MNTQPEALRLAEQLDGAPYSSFCTNEAAAELRRLHEENTALRQAIEQAQKQEQTDWEQIAKVQNAKLMAMCDEKGGFEKLCEVMDRYEAQKQEPVAWPHKYGCRANAFGKCDMGCTTPPQRKPLTDEQVIRGGEAVSDALRKIGMAVSDEDLNATEIEQEIAEYVFTQMQEAKLKE